MDQTPNQSHHTHKIKRLHLALIILIFIVVISVGVLVWYLISTRQNDEANRKAVSENIAKDVSKDDIFVTKKMTKISSSLGYSLSYDPTLITSTGQVTDSKASKDGKVYWEEYKDNELSTERPYSIIKFRQDGESLTSPTLSISTNIRGNFWDSHLANPANASKTKVAILKDIILSGRTDVATSEVSSKNITIKGVDYLQVTVSPDTSSYGVRSETSDLYFFTVQHDRPYWAVISNSETDSALQATYEQIIATLSYSPTDAAILGSTQPKISLAAAELPEDTSYVPSTIDDETIVDVVLKNQPAVVRIASIRCGTVTLTKENATASFNYTCAAGVGSGSFISSDGYIATNGHVVTITERSLLTQSLNSIAAVEKLVTFLVSIQSITTEQGTRLISGVRAGNSSALSALQQLSSQLEKGLISISRDVTHYGVQLSNQPIRFNTDKTDISYNESVVAAKLVAVDYDATNSEEVLQGKVQGFTHSDVAILKASGSFPTVELGTIDELSDGDTLTAIGYPAFIDDSLSTDQWQTVPTITQGEITAITQDANFAGRQLIATTIQIAPGNSGGPAFDTSGKQIGLNTYARISCADKQCFGNGTIRDVADLKKLAADNNITLKQGDLTKQWHDALDSYESGNYAQALKRLDSVKRDYPANYLAPELSRSARAQTGSDTDTSDSTSLVPIIIISIITGAGLIAIITCAILLVRIKKQPVIPHY